MPAVDADESGGDRIDGDRPQRGAEARVAQHEKKHGGNDAGADKGEQTVHRDGRAQHMNGRRQERVTAQVAAPVNQGEPLEDEEEAKGDKHDIGVERVLVRRAADQWHHQHLINNPAQREGERHADKQAEQRIDLPQHDRKEGDEGAADEKFAVGQVQNAGDAVLKIQSERDEPVHPSQDNAVDKDFE